jgi:hypothetical protein
MKENLPLLYVRQNLECGAPPQPSLYYHAQKAYLISPNVVF